MNPATIALLFTGVGEASKLIAEILELYRKGEAGELTEEQVLANYRQMQAKRAATREAWDRAGE